MRIVAGQLVFMDFVGLMAIIGIEVSPEFA